MGKRDEHGNAGYQPNVLTATEIRSDGSVHIMEYVHDRFNRIDDSHGWEWNVTAHRKARQQPIGSVDVEVWYNTEEWWIKNNIDKSIPFSVFLFSMGLVDG